MTGGLAQLARGPFCRKCASCTAGPDFSTLPKIQQREGFATDLL